MHPRGRPDDPDNEILKLKQESLEEYGPTLHARLLAIANILKQTETLVPTAVQAQLGMSRLALTDFYNKLHRIIEGLNDESPFFYKSGDLKKNILEDISEFDRACPFIIDEINNNPEIYTPVLHPQKITSPPEERPAPATPEIEEKKTEFPVIKLTLTREQAISNIENLLFSQNGAYASAYYHKISKCLSDISKSLYPDRLLSYQNLFSALLKKNWDAIDGIEKVDKPYLDEKMLEMNAEKKNQVDATTKAQNAFIEEHKKIRKFGGLFQKVDYGDTLSGILQTASTKNNTSYLVCKNLGWTDSKGNVLPVADVAHKYRDIQPELRSKGPRHRSES